MEGGSQCLVRLLHGFLIPWCNTPFVVGLGCSRSVVDTLHWWLVRIQGDHHIDLHRTAVLDFLHRV